MEVLRDEVIQYIKTNHPLGSIRQGYKKNLIKFLITIVGRPIQSHLLLLIPSKTDKMTNCCPRRWEEIYSIDRLMFINWNHPEGKQKGLVFGQWCLLNTIPFSEAKPENRGVNKRLASTVFKRDGSKCVRCGARNGELHHIFTDKYVKLHIGHISPFVLENTTKKYTADDFTTLCSICNEGEKAHVMTHDDRIYLIEKQIKYLQQELKKHRSNSI